MIVLIDSCRMGVYIYIICMYIQYVFYMYMYLCPKMIFESCQITEMAAVMDGWSKVTDIFLGIKKAQEICAGKG